MSTRKLSTLLSDTAGLSVLTRASQRIAALQRLYEVCTPPDLAQASRVINEHDGMLIVAADNGAIAAKLRQLAKRLLEALRKQRAQITGIRVQIQVRNPAPAPRQRAHKSTLPVDLIEHFESISLQVKDPDLRRALSRFAARRRSE